MTDTILIEVSWETANMVGGIHTVLATKAASMRASYPQGYITIGPDLWKDSPDPPAFRAEEIFPGLETDGLSVRQGRWTIPGEPACLLVDFSPLYADKDRLLADLWEHYGVDSLTGAWDYVEPALFGLAAGKVIARLTEHLVGAELVAQFHEWMVAAGMLTLPREAPHVGTVFTTHATVLGRALSGEGDAMDRVLLAPPEDMARLARSRGVLAKHSLEAAAAHHADCFTTVSQTTAAEATVLLGRTPDVVLPNGLGDAYPPPEHGTPEARAATRERLRAMLATCLGREVPDSTTILLSSGRPEFTNKGIDLAIDAVANLEDRDVILLLAFPGNHTGPNRELLAAARGGRAPAAPIHVTHDLADPDADAIAARLASRGLTNAIYVPIYLDGRDPMVPLSYFELLPAADLTLFPSHYEPWGYTPMESIGYGVPTITSDKAGFGVWAAEHGGWADTGVHVLERSTLSYDEALAHLTKVIQAFVALDADARAVLSDKARALAARANWTHFAAHYRDAHEQALARAHERVRTHAPRSSSRAMFRSLTVTGGDIQAPRLRHVTVVGKLPDELSRLRELAYNLHWAWDDETRALLAELSPHLPDDAPFNPLERLNHADPERARAAIDDPGFMATYRRACERLDQLVASRRTPTIGYFCAEFGITGALPMYAGGMGVLAGDHLKAASDLNLPLVAIGLAYRHGYFRQRIDEDGQQHAEVTRNDFASLPMHPVTDDDGDRLTVPVGLPGRSVDIGAWRVDVGRIQLYLLDTDLPSNTAEDRQITNQLYGGGEERRLQQEIVLALGGYRLLGALGLPIDVYHMNEGHSAFLILARAKHLVQEHSLKLDEALEYIRQTTLFTTHTPVPAGHDAFPEAMMRPYFSHYEHYLHIPWNQLLDLGHWPNQDAGQRFSMTLLALRGAAQVNGVSRIHGGISRQMFHNLFPGFQTDEVPVDHITNGVHMPSWISPQLQQHLDLAALHTGDELDTGPLDDATLWAVHQTHKRRLLDVLHRRLESHRPASARRRHLDVLTEDALLIAFARRFAPYKRAALVFEDLDKLRHLLRTSPVPIVFLFAGKAHPADTIGQQLIRDIHELGKHPDLQGHILVLENYDLPLARLLVQGADVWLNNPTRPLEASGTSGMKAAANGVLNLSVQDGWWAEAYAEDNGWSIGGAYDPARIDEDNAADHGHLIDLLTHEVLPAFTTRTDGLPTAWLETMRRSIATCAARFSSARMVHDYHTRFYQPMLERAPVLSADDYAAVTATVERRRRIDKAWPTLRVERAEIGGLPDNLEVPLGTPVELLVELRHPGLEPDDLLVQVLHGPANDEGELVAPTVIALAGESNGSPDKTRWQGNFTPSHSGALAFGVRVVPRHGQTPDRTDHALKRVRWI